MLARSEGTKPDRLNSIQTSRALAAISVLLFHEKVLSIGYCGVDVFFVISGFVMGTIGVNEAPLKFMINRLIRIVPLYWAVTVILCLLSFIPGAFKMFTFDAESLFKSLLFIPYTDSNGKIWPLVVAGWTLNYEVFFYAIFTLGLFCGRAIFFTIFVMVVLAVLGLVVPARNPLVHTYTDAILLEFAAGLALACFPRIKGLRLGLALLMVGIALFIRADLARLGDIESFSRLAILGLPAVSVVLGALCLERAGYWPRSAALEAVGDASYSLYLLHGFAVAFLNKFLHLPAPLTVSITIASSLIAALLSYRGFERPLGRMLRSAFVRRLPTAAKA